MTPNPPTTHLTSPSGLHRPGVIAADLDTSTALLSNQSQRVRSACRAFTTRRFPEAWLGELVTNAQPSPGDLMLARVETLGQHPRLHLPNGRRRQLFVGDEILVVYGDRYASDQYEAHVPDHLGPCHLVAGAGMAAVMQRKHREMRSPTGLQPIGLVTHHGNSQVVNARLAALPIIAVPDPWTIPVLAVAGTSMNAGKTTTAAYLTRGLTKAGYRVGYIKATGTSASGDPGLLEDAGAVITLDCLDAGFVSTYRVPVDQITRSCVNLMAHALAKKPDVLVIEIADGLLQAETAAFLQSQISRSYFHGMLFAAGDAMGAAMGCEWLTQHGHRILGVTGTLTSAPLQAEEAAAATGFPIHRTSDLAAPALANSILNQLLPTRSSHDS